MSSFPSPAWFLGCPRRVPLRPARRSLARRSAATLQAYRKSVGRFLVWCGMMQLPLRTVDDVDDLLVEWQETDSTVSKSIYAQAICGVEIAVPLARRQLLWARTVLGDWEVIAPVRHHLPLPRALAFLISAALSLLGYGRLAAGLLIQQALGLRPGELLRLRAKDVTLPESTWFGARTDAVLSLGAKRGTKAKRAQAVVLRGQQHPLLLELLRSLVKSTDPGDFLLEGISTDTMNRRLRKVTACLGLSDYTAHSPRAGFATDEALSGSDFTTTREKMRLVSDASLRNYLDAVATATASASREAEYWSRTIEQIQASWSACRQT